MKFDDTNADVVFSRGMHDINLSREESDRSDPYYITVDSDDVGEYASDTLMMFDGKGTIYLKDIARSAVVPIDFSQIILSLSPESPSYNLSWLVGLRNMTVRMEDNDDRIIFRREFKVLPGGRIDQAGRMQNGLDSLKNIWLTGKDAVTETCRNGCEILSAYIAPGIYSKVSSLSMLRVNAKVYFAMSAPEILTIAEYPPALIPGHRLLCINASYGAVSQMTATRDRILAYDVYADAEGSDDSGAAMSERVLPPHRFIVADNNLRLREFIYRNSLGVMDTVYAAGQSGRSVKSSCETFVSDGVESVLENNAEVSYSINSGNVRTNGGTAQWHELIASEEVYYLEPGRYRIPAKVIIDETEAEGTEMEANSFDIKFRFSENNRNMHFGQPRQLQDFDYGTTEF